MDVAEELVPGEFVDAALEFTALQRSAGESSDAAAALVQLLGGLFRDDSDTRRHWLIWFDFWSASGV
ncbi:hypothetical protein B7R25_15985 [Subtercola boreus]|uniref:Uncharacterized protein n=2 Tax=Subtercola boreus TaxID=120213 RepID=A0A3E0W9W1_9MICO|nr:hypothetical protein B7R24_15955 [Subtercola boreus]RFA18519.1 hypothetical protein B7R23_15990 [Subtercola boreus]RFA25047.1 hypothetical protein B7R25_15985 [Subtercola boreus]